MKYKIGDKLKIKDNTSRHHFHIGQEVKIFSFSVFGYWCTDGKDYWVVGDDELEEIQNKGFKFKKGDKVIVKDKTHGHGFQIGEEVLILATLDWEPNAYQCENLSGKVWYLGENEIEEIKTNQNTVMTKKQMVEKVATDLCVANNTVSTLEIKTELRKQYPANTWYQSDVSQLMGELYDDGTFDYTDNGTFRVYSLVQQIAANVIAGNTNVAATTAVVVPTKKVKAKKPLPSTQTVSRTKALELIEKSAGKFFKVKFTKKDNTEREMTCQYVKAVAGTKSHLGYVDLKDVQAMKNGEKATIKSVNLQTLSEIKISNVTYKVK